MKEIIRCSQCDRVVARANWVEQTRETKPGVFEGVYWCRLCQANFPVRLEAVLDYVWTSDGYILVKVPGRGWIREHLYIWEQHNGPLPLGHLIHHIDGDKTNNNLENLVAIPKRSHNTHSPKDKPHKR